MDARVDGLKIEAGEFEDPTAPTEMVYPLTPTESVVSRETCWRAALPILAIVSIRICTHLPERHADKTRAGSPAAASG